MTKWRWLMVGFLMLYVPLSRGLVLAALWDWCVSTLGVAQIRVVQAWGLWLITTFLRMTHPLDEEYKGRFGSAPCIRFWTLSGVLVDVSRSADNTV